MTSIVLNIALLFTCVLGYASESVERASDTGFAIIGDAGKNTANAQLVRNSLVRHQVSHTILPGDNLYSGTYQSVWTPWRTAGIGFDVVAIGNHNGGYAKEVAYFAMPSEYFSKVIDGAKFLVLNSNNDKSGPAQAAWLDQQLKVATEKIIFLVYHHPSYTISSFHTWTEKKTFQTALRPVIWKYRAKLTALLVGHDHLASILHFNDLPVLLSGAVQEVRKDKPVSNVQDGVKVQTAWYFDSTAHWAKLTWDSMTATARVDYIRAKDDRNSCTALLTTGASAQLAANCARR